MTGLAASQVGTAEDGATRALVVIGRLWFPEPGDRRIWNDLLGWDVARQVTFSLGGVHLQLEIVVGFPRAWTAMPWDAPQILYLPPGGLSDHRLDTLLSRAAHDAPYHLVRLFPLSELSYLPNNEPAVRDLWVEARRRHSRTPFLGLADDPASREALHQWLHDITRLTLARRQFAAWQNQWHLAERETDSLLRQVQPRPITNVESLANLLTLRAAGRLLQQQFMSLERQLESVRQAIGDLQGGLEVSAKQRYEETGRHIYGEQFTVNLGEELLPGLRALLPQIRDFGKRLQASPVPDLQSLGQDLAAQLDKQRPILALVGAFSSGKTTLLNTLLIGKESRRAFRTRATANTAIVSEIYAAPTRQAEQVRFKYRDHVDHILCDTSSGAGLDRANQQNIRELLGLLQQGVLYHPKLLFIPPKQGGAGEVGRLPPIEHGGGLGRESRFGWPGRESAGPRVDLPVRIPEKDLDIRRYLELLTDPNVGNVPNGQLTFVAQVDPARRDRAIRERRLLDVIPLDTEDGWSEFQGDGTWAEGFTASMLVEWAEIRLHHPLLELTTLADTPGIGSYNDRHDIVTGHYINRADGFLVLLPTKDADAFIVQKMLKRIREKLAAAYKNDPRLGLNTVAFVVNAFTQYNREENLHWVQQYERMLCETFGIPWAEWQQRQADPRRANFFIVKLKQVADGQLAEKLYDYPSLGPLRRWIEQLFVSGTYGERFNRVRATLDDRWRDSKLALRKQVQAAQSNTASREAAAAKVAAFRTGELQTLTEQSLAEITTFRKEFHSGPDSLRHRVAVYLERYGNDPSNLHKEALDRWERGLVAHYKELNMHLNRFQRLDPAKAWSDNVEMALRALNINPLALEPPDPADQRPAWSVKQSTWFDTQAVATAFNEIRQKWPNPLGRAREFFKCLFVEDMRQKMAKNLGDSFWLQQYNVVWNGLEVYLRRCEEYLQSKQVAVEQLCREREASLRATPNSGDTAFSHAALEAFEALEAERSQLVRALEYELTSSLDRR